MLPRALGLAKRANAALSVQITKSCNMSASALKCPRTLLHRQQGCYARAQHLARRCVVTAASFNPHGAQHQHGRHSQRPNATSCLEVQSVRSLSRSTPIAPSSSTHSSSRLRVAVDVDEVLGRFVFALNQFVEQKYHMRHQVSDYWVYEFAKVWGCDQEKSNYIVHEFFKSDHFTDGIPVIPGAFDALSRMSDSYDLVVVTSRQHVIQDQTLEWIDKHYGGIFQDVYFGNHWSLEGVSRKKSDICKAVGASLLIDDNPSYATECAAAGINVLLYDWNRSYPWSKLAEGQQHSLIRIVSNWEEVESHVTALAPELAAKQQAAAAARVSSTKH